MFKDTHVFEFYLNRNLAKKYKNSISRFRVSAHNLAIETGRHQKPKIPKENRICVFCTSRHIDNEIHLLIDCEFHINERNILFCCADNEIVDFRHLSEMEMFRSILASWDSALMYELGKFLLNSFQKRKEASRLNL